MSDTTLKSLSSKARQRRRFFISLTRFVAIIALVSMTFAVGRLIYRRKSDARNRVEYERLLEEKMKNKNVPNQGKSPKVSQTDGAGK